MTVAVEQSNVQRWLDGRRSWPQRGRLTALALALATVLALVGWWGTTSHALATGGNELSAPVAVGDSLYTGLSIGPGGVDNAVTVNLRSITPNVVENTAAATIEIELCSGPRSVGMVNGGSLTDVGDSCATLTPFQPGSRRRGEQLPGYLVVITPHRAGVVKLAGVEVSYWHHLRHGHTRSGDDILVRAS